MIYKSLKDIVYYMMKLGVAVLLLTGAVLSAEETDVAVQLASFRSEFRTHNYTDKPGFAVKLELTPAPGLSLCGTENLEPKMTAIDANGKKLKATTARLKTDVGGSDKAYAVFTIPKRPNGKKVKLEGEMQLTVARDLVQHAPQSINLLEDGKMTLGTTEFTVTPAKTNAAKKNREGERLRHAEVTLSYPAQLSIMQISRCWEQEPGAEDAAADSYTQELDYSTTLSKDGTTKTTTIELQDVRHCPMLQISTCAEKKNITVPFHFEVTLSEAVELQSTEPKQQSDKKK